MGRSHSLRDCVMSQRRSEGGKEQAVQWRVCSGGVRKCEEGHVMRAGRGGGHRPWGPWKATAKTSR